MAEVGTDTGGRGHQNEAAAFAVSLYMGVIQVGEPVNGPGLSRTCMDTAPLKARSSRLLLTPFPRSTEHFVNSFSAGLSLTEIITSQQATHMLEEEPQKVQISANKILSICKAITEL